MIPFISIQNCCGVVMLMNAIWYRWAMKKKRRQINNSNQIEGKMWCRRNRATVKNRVHKTYLNEVYQNNRKVHRHTHIHTQVKRRNRQKWKKKNITQNGNSTLKGLKIVISFPIDFCRLSSSPIIPIVITNQFFNSFSSSFSYFVRSIYGEWKKKNTHTKFINFTLLSSLEKVRIDLLRYSIQFSSIECYSIKNQSYSSSVFLNAFLFRSQWNHFLFAMVRIRLAHKQIIFSFDCFFFFLFIKERNIRSIHVLHFIEICSIIIQKSGCRRRRCGRCRYLIKASLSRTRTRIFCTIITYCT